MQENRRICSTIRAASSRQLFRFPGHGGVPVGFPGLAAVEGKCLLPLRAVGARLDLEFRIVKPGAFNKALVTHLRQLWQSHGGGRETL